MVGGNIYGDVFHRYGKMCRTLRFPAVQQQEIYASHNATKRFPVCLCRARPANRPTRRSHCRAARLNRLGSDSSFVAQPNQHFTNFGFLQQGLYNFFCPLRIAFLLSLLFLERLKQRRRYGLRHSGFLLGSGVQAACKAVQTRRRKYFSVWFYCLTISKRNKTYRRPSVSCIVFCSITSVFILNHYLFKNSLRNTCSREIAYEFIHDLYAIPYPLPPCINEACAMQSASLNFTHSRCAVIINCLLFPLFWDNTAR